jgi:hypothetical protein
MDELSFSLTNKHFIFSRVLPILRNIIKAMKFFFTKVKIKFMV